MVALGRGKVHPSSPLYKGRPWGGGLSLVCRPSPPLSHHFLSRGLPKGCTGARLHHRCTPSCRGVSGSRSKPSAPAISARLGIPGVVLIIVCVQVHGSAANCGAGVVAPSSSNNLEVGYVGFINIDCAGALIPRSIYKGMWKSIFLQNLFLGVCCQYLGI
jgi:hypothetical protein